MKWLLVITLLTVSHVAKGEDARVGYQVNPEQTRVPAPHNPSCAPNCGVSTPDKDQKSEQLWAKASVVANSLAAFGAVGAFFAVAYQNRANRISSQRQLRAYIVPEQGNIANVADVTPDPPELEQFARVVNRRIGPLVTIGIKNVGATPSYDVMHRASIYIRAYTNPPAVLVQVPNNGELSTIILGPQIGSTLDIWLPHPLTELEIQNLVAGLAVIYVAGIIQYTDIFGVPHTTHYQMEHHSARGKIGWNTTLVFSPNGNGGD